MKNKTKITFRFDEFTTVISVYAEIKLVREEIMRCIKKQIPYEFTGKNEFVLINLNKMNTITFEEILDEKH